MTEDWQAGGFGLYIHWPFCAAKCPYCDFNSHVSRQIDQDRWRAAYLRELDRVAEETRGRVLNTVFFGGGTPSLMDPDLVCSILERVKTHWPMGNDPEITLEANPGSVEAGRFTGYAQAGVTRISMGIQSLNDTDLRRLGRIHSVADARHAFEIARTQFERVSFDLIYARQGQSLDAWEAELKEAAAMAVDHLSLYQLTIEEGTAFGDRYKAGKLRDLPAEDLASDMFEHTQEVLAGLGYEAYEISNHAKPGSESRHNLIYWHYGDYIGIGPGAHGRVTLAEQRVATETALFPDAWLERVERLGSGETLREPIDPKAQAQEYLLMGLRLSTGIDISRYARLNGASFDPDVLSHLQGLGVIDLDSQRLWATLKGRMVLNAVIAELSGD